MGAESSRCAWAQIRLGASQRAFTTPSSCVFLATAAGRVCTYVRDEYRTRVHTRECREPKARPIELAVISRWCGDYMHAEDTRFDLRMMGIMDDIAGRCWARSVVLIGLLRRGNDVTTVVKRLEMKLYTLRDAR